MLLLELLSGFLLELAEAGGNSPLTSEVLYRAVSIFTLCSSGHLRHFLCKADLPGTVSFPSAPIYSR